MRIEMSSKTRERLLYLISPIAFLASSNGTWA